MSKTNLVIIVLIILVLGLSIGFFAGIKKGISTGKNTGGTGGNTINLPESTIIRQWTAVLSGYVKEKDVLNRTLTIAAATKDDILQVKLDQETQIGIAKQDEAGFEIEKAEFKYIQLGDQVSITAVFNNNEFRAINVNILADLVRYEENEARFFE